MNFSKIVSILSVAIISSACTSQNLLDADGNPLPQTGAAFEAIDSPPTTVEEYIETLGEASQHNQIVTPPEMQAASPAPATPLIGEDIPVVRFKGTSISEKYAGDKVALVGSHSYMDIGSIALFRWTQPDNGQPLVDIKNANSPEAYFIATPEINGVLLTFELQLIGNNYNTATGRFMYAWIVMPESEKPVEVDEQTDSNTDTSSNAGEDVIDDVNYTMGTTGDYFAKSATSIYVADQDNNRIVHVNAATGQEVNSYQLSDTPKYLDYIDTSNSLYVSFKFSDSIVKINLDTDAVTPISIAGTPRDLHSYKDKVFFTVDNAADFNQYDLYSIDNTDVPVSHGTVSGNLITHNPANDQLITADSYEAGVSVFEYDANNQVVEVQTNLDISSDATDLAVSPSGTQLAIATPTGNGGGYTIHDIMPTDLSVSNGAWDTSANPNSVAFSNDGSIVAATNMTDLKLYDAMSHTELKHQVVNFQACGLDFYELDNASFTLDGEHVVVRLECGFDQERTTLFFYRLN